MSFARLYILRPRHLGQKRQSPRHRHRPRPHWDGEKETRTIHLICDSWLPIGAISERTDGQESEWEAFSDRQRLACASWLLPPPSISPLSPRSPRNIHRWDKRPVTDGWPKLDSLYGPAVICGSTREEGWKEQEGQEDIASNSSGCFIALSHRYGRYHVGILSRLEVEKGSHPHGRRSNRSTGMHVCRRQHLHFKKDVLPRMGERGISSQRSNPRELCASIHHERMVTFVIILLQQLARSKTASTTKGSHLPKTRMAKMMSQSKRTLINGMASGERPPIAKAGNRPKSEVLFHPTYLALLSLLPTRD